MDGRLQQQLLKDGCSSTRENWMGTSGQCTMFYKSSHTDTAAYPVARYELRAVVSQQDSLDLLGRLVISNTVAHINGHHQGLLTPASHKH